jgi:hypothetical protein
MKKLIAGLIIVLLLGGIFGFAPSMAYADGADGGVGTTGTVLPPPAGRGDAGASMGANGSTLLPPPAGM